MNLHIANIKADAIPSKTKRERHSTETTNFSEWLDPDVRFNRLIEVALATGKSLDIMEAQTRCMNVQTFQRWVDNLIDGPDARLFELNLEIAAADEARENAMMAATTVPDDPDEQAEVKRAVEHYWNLVEEICLIPAHTIDGLRIKLELWQESAEGCESNDAMALAEVDLINRTAVSALRDARRLAQE